MESTDRRGPARTEDTMKSVLRQYSGECVALAVVLAIGSALLPPWALGADSAGPHGSIYTVHNESGMARTINVAGFPVVAESNPFFLDLGVNGRRCVTCHEPTNNMGIGAAGVQARFDATGGTDPIFRTNDGSNSPLADVSTEAARRLAYSMLVTKGLIRVSLPIPAGAEFELVDVRDPYGYAGNNANGNELSLFRRPLPTTNLTFLSTVMWDGRETLQKGSSGAIHFDLAHQSNSATQGHAHAPSPLDDATREQIIAYETALYTAQVFDGAAGELHAAGALGGPEELSLKPFVFGVNDPLGCDPTGASCNPQNAAFDPIVFTEYAAWENLSGGGRNAARAAVARGQALFNTLPIPIAGVSGINDDFNVPLVMGTCSTCHDTPHAGNHSVPAPLNIGIADPPVGVAGGGGRPGPLEAVIHDVYSRARGPSSPRRQPRRGDPEKVAAVTSRDAGARAPGRRSRTASGLSNGPEEGALRDALPSELRPPFTLSLHTGLRWGERALRWQDVDVLSGLITIGGRRMVPRVRCR